MFRSPRSTPTHPAIGRDSDYRALTPGGRGEGDRRQDLHGGYRALRPLVAAYGRLFDPLLEIPETFLTT